jgi:Calcineurin-like phosphoesterase
LRLAILNDIHLNLTYEYTCGFPFCYDQGIYGVDAPTALFDTILDDLHDNYHFKKVDAILILGDFIRHGLSKNDPNSNNWAKQKIIV